MRLAAVARSMGCARISGTRVVVRRRQPALDMAPGCLGILLQQGFCGVARVARKRFVFLQVGVAQQRQTALALAEEFARPALSEVLGRDLEAVTLLENHLEARTRRLGQWRRVEQDADA